MSNETEKVGYTIILPLGTNIVATRKNKKNKEEAIEVFDDRGKIELRFNDAKGKLWKDFTGGRSQGDHRHTIIFFLPGCDEKKGITISNIPLAGRLITISPTPHPRKEEKHAYFIDKDGKIVGDRRLDNANLQKFIDQACNTRVSEEIFKLSVVKNADATPETRAKIKADAIRTQGHRKLRLTQD